MIYIYYINEIYVYMMIHIYIYDWLILMIYHHIYNMVDHVFFRSSLSSMMFVLVFQEDLAWFWQHQDMPRCIPRQRLRGKEDGKKRWNLGTKRRGEPHFQWWTMLLDVGWCVFLILILRQQHGTHTHKMWFCEVKFNLVILFSKIYPDPQVCRWFLHWFSVLRFLDNFPTWDTVLRLVKSWVWDGPEMRKWMVRPR